MKKNIIWDFNGTLLDDVKFAVDLTNKLLNKRSLPPLSLEKYKEIFTFPVFEYYKKAGFDHLDKNTFNEISDEFISKYFNEVKTCSLKKNALHVIENFHKREYNQYILSAMEEKKLSKMVEHYKINKYFKSILGIENNHAEGKVHLVKRLKNIMNNSETWLIGDTVHDFKVAIKLNAKAILLSDGHQSRNRLEKTSAFIADDIYEVISIVQEA